MHVYEMTDADREIRGRAYKGCYARVHMDDRTNRLTDRQIDGFLRVQVWYAAQRVPLRCAWGCGHHRCPAGDYILRFPDGFEEAVTEATLSEYWVRASFLRPGQEVEPTIPGRTGLRATRTRNKEDSW